MILRRKQKLKLRRILSTPPVADAIINSGPREAGTDPIQISGGDSWTPRPCSEPGEISGGM